MRLLTGAERNLALAYFRRVCANDVGCGHYAGDEERANFTRVLWFLVQREAFVWVYEPESVADSRAWRLGVYDGQCLGALCWDVQACHVRPGCVAPYFEELPPRTAPWLRSVVGAPKGRKPKAEAKSKRGAHLNSGRASGSVRECGGGAGASSSSTIPACVEAVDGFRVVAFEADDNDVDPALGGVSDARLATAGAVGAVVSATGSVPEVVAAARLGAPAVDFDDEAAVDRAAEMLFGILPTAD